MGERRGTKALELWCRRITDGYSGVNVQNMTTSWRDGLAFCAMIHHFRPDLIDFDSLDKNDIYGNNELAFRIAEQHLGIPALLDAEDMASCSVPDRLSILTYLSQFYQTFGGTSPARLAVNRTTETASERISQVPESPKEKEVPCLGVRKDLCAVCGLPIFLAEKLVLSHVSYHRTCFRCARCSSQLTLGNYYETEEGQYCCETCPDEEIPSPGARSNSEGLLSISTESKDSDPEQSPGYLDKGLAGHFVPTLGRKDPFVPDLIAQTSQLRLNFMSSQLVPGDQEDLAELRKPGQLLGTAKDEEGREKFLTRSRSNLRAEPDDLPGETPETSFQDSGEVHSGLDESLSSESSFSQLQKRWRMLENGKTEVGKPRVKSVDAEAHRMKPADTEAPRIKTMDVDALRNKSVDVDTHMMMPVDAEAHTIKSVDTKAHKIKPVDAEDHRMKPMDVEARRFKPVDVEAAHRMKSVDAETHKMKSADTEAHRIKSADTENHRMEPVDAEARRFKPVDVEVHGMKSVDSEVYRIKPMDLEAHRIKPEGAEARRMKPVDGEVLRSVGKASNMIRGRISGSNLRKIIANDEVDCRDSPEGPEGPLPPLQEQNSGALECLVEGKPEEPEDYPEDLNPFKSDDEEQSVVREASRSTRDLTNPFESNEEDEEEEEQRSKSVPPKPALRNNVNNKKGGQQFLMEKGAKRRLAAPEINLNPFLSDEDDYDSDLETGEQNSKFTPVPKPRTIKHVPETNASEQKVSLNGSHTLKSPSRISDSETGFGGTYRKKKPAPLPPSKKEMYSSDQLATSTSDLSSNTSGYHESPSQATPKARKTKPAPPPPLSIANTIVTPSLSFVEAHVDESENITTRKHNLWEDEKTSKDEANRNRQSSGHLSCEENFHYTSYVNKSVQGKWKRKKGPAPPCPTPHRRKIKVMSLKDVKLELDEIELQQQGLEKQGVRLEQLIRSKCESGPRSNDTSLGSDVEELVLELFSLVNEKNELFRRQAELMLLRRQQRLEEEHAEVEYQIRCLMSQHESTKTDFDKQKEEALIQRLVEIVERRNEIVDCLEMDRRREVEEDKSIHKHMDLFTVRNKNGLSNADTDTSEKKKRKQNKLKQKGGKEVKMKKAASKDVDKDIDEAELKVQRHKRKWF